MGRGNGLGFLEHRPENSTAVCTLVGVAVGVTDATGVAVGVKKSTAMLLVPQADSSAARAAAAITAGARLIETSLWLQMSA